MTIRAGNDGLNSSSNGVWRRSGDWKAVLARSAVRSKKDECHENHAQLD